METEAIATRLAPVLTELGLECLGVEWNAGRGGGLLRVYIDAFQTGSAPPRAVNVDDCEAASREISALLEVHDLIPGHYVLEVSSPGLERPLFTTAQYRRFIGAEVRVVLKLPRDGRRRFRGTIATAEDAVIGIDVDGRREEIAEGEIESAHLVPDWDALGYAPRPKPGKTAKGAKGKARRRH
jgi:ribosome maturation factor RimP